MNMLECLQIFLGKKPVALGIPLRAYKLRKLVGPEADQGRVLTQDLRNFSDCV
jgi:hypothetical protein